jgi:hypothetical protein
MEEEMDLILYRRGFILGACAASVAAAVPTLADTRPALHVLKDPNCGCCSAWVEIIQAEGFEVTVEESIGTALARYKIDNGIPQEMGSGGCFRNARTPLASPCLGCPTDRPAWARRLSARPMKCS